MIVGTILLTQNDEYVDKDGNLPTRPSFDKAFITGLYRGKSVSKVGLKLLPPSIKKVLNLNGEFMPVSIRELAKADMLIVIRSSDFINNGLKFRFTEFIQILKLKEIELWIRKEKKK